MTCRLLSLGLLWFLLGIGAPLQIHGESPGSFRATHHRVGLQEQQKKRLPATTVTVSSQLTQSQIYAPIIAFVAVPTPVPPPTPPPSPDQTEEILIPAGEFQMGCDMSNPIETCSPNQKPLHTVYLDAYFIDKYEVTNARYKACVEAGGCTPPWQNNSYTRSHYYGNPEFDNYPVIRVNWYQATAFCSWGGKRLPTEAEWERAARGNQDTRKFPWGNSPADDTLLNYNNRLHDTDAVGSYPGGASPDGLMDMAGNVWEWVNDWYAGAYYKSSPLVNPPGPPTGEYRVRRGGSWLNKESDMRAAGRSLKPPEHWPSAIGIRCVRPVQ